MICSIKHKGWKELWEKDKSKFLPKDMIVKIKQILEALDNMTEFPADIAIFKNWDLHELQGKRKGVWSIAVKKNWKLTFKVDNLKIIDLDFEDYH